MKVKLRAQISFDWEYEADSKNYGTDNIEEMIELDIKLAKDDLFMFLELCDKEEKIKITQVK